jgi:hypothetical protein
MTSNPEVIVVRRISIDVAILAWDRGPGRSTVTAPYKCCVPPCRVRAGGISSLSQRAVSAIMPEW